MSPPKISEIESIAQAIKVYAIETHYVYAIETHYL